MTDKPIGSALPRSPDWDEFVHELSAAGHFDAQRGSTGQSPELISSTRRSGNALVEVRRSDALNQAILEIEQAAAALRVAEPSLDVWTAQRSLPAGKQRPIWSIIAVLWLSTGLFVAGTILALAHFVR